MSSIYKVIAHVFFHVLNFRFDDVISGLETIFKNRIDDSKVDSGTKVVEDIMSGAMLVLSSISGESQIQFTLQPSDFVNMESLLNLTKEKNLTEQFVASFMASSFILPDMVRDILP